MKHILGMSLYTILICYAICFGGEHFFPEPEAKYRFERAAENRFVYPGRPEDWD